MRASFALRIRIFAVCIILVTFFFGVRLYDIQIVKGSAFREEAESQYLQQSVERFDRGAILFRPQQGPAIAAATLSSGFRVAIIPREIDDELGAYEALSKHIELDRNSFLLKATDKDDPYEEIARRVPLAVGADIRKDSIAGVRLVREKWRYYPGGSAASHTLGFVGFGSGSVLSGQYGLERFYNDVLTKDSAALHINFFADLFAGIKSRLEEGNHRSGADVLTSIEPTVQGFTEDILMRYQETWSPQEVGIIILDPKTGEIVAMGALPSFNPNSISDANPRTFTNPLVERVYEFGSTIKALTLAAGIDSGAITPDTTYTDNGTAVYDGSRISNFDGKARGLVSMQEVIGQSLNTGVGFIVERMGKDAFRDYFERFGLRESTGIDLPNEAEPLTSNLESPRMIEYVTASFGQGIAVTPVALARALAVLANGGLLPSPHVGVELRYGGGFTRKLGWGQERRVISRESAETTTRMLVEVVDTSLRDGKVKIPEMSVAAKTGTAQIARSDARGYYTDRYLHSFFGYFPAYEPRFLVFLYAVAPQGARYSSETLTDPFIESIRFLTSYYNIPPDRGSPRTGAPLP